MLTAAAVGWGGLNNGAPTLSPEHYDIWRQVRERVPREGIVFTSETGRSINSEQGWNYYPGVSGRQVYLAGWSSSPLLVDPVDRERRLRLNDEVVTGRRDPRSVAPERSAYFVVARKESPRPGRVVHANDRFVLYEIP